MMNSKNLPLVCLIFLFLLVSCHAKEPPQGVLYKRMFEANDIIWGFDFIDASHVIMTLRGGKMQVVDLNSNAIMGIRNVPAVFVGGQGGLLDVALHPQFSKNHWIYFSYSIADGKARETRIARAKLENYALENFQVLFTSNSKSETQVHFGSRIAFDEEGHVFFTVGERGHQENAQDLRLANGKVHRIYEDGKVPSDNPFFGKKNTVPSIWSYGHRNPQGLFYDKTTKTLWEQEHGPKGGDEINVILKGKNYGWPVITYGREYSGEYIGPDHKEGMQQPFYYYVPSIAPSGLCVYHGNIYSGALVLTHLNRLVVSEGKVIREERFLENIHERVRNVKASPDDKLYISTDSGKLLLVKMD